MLGRSRLVSARSACRLVSIAFITFDPHQEKPMSNRTRSVRQVARMIAYIPEFEDLPRPTITRILGPFGEPAVAVCWLGTPAQGAIEACYSTRWMSVSHFPASGPINERVIRDQADLVGYLRHIMAKVFGKGDYR
jgi:hypothetical protein